MEQYKIKIYKEAQNDLEEIVEYLNHFYDKTSLKYYDLIIEKIRTLDTMPERGVLVRDEPLRWMGYRYLIVENYVVLFIVKGNEVQIRRILYNKRQYKGLLY